MKAVLPKPVHATYQRHRRQRTTQIILPIVLAAIVFLAACALITVATFRWNGDVARWAAISTMWIAIPVFIIGLVFLALLVGIIYLLIRLLGITPIYTNKAQTFVQMLASRIQHAADATVKPFMFWDGIGASIQKFFGGK